MLGCGCRTGGLHHGGEDVDCGSVVRREEGGEVGGEEEAVVVRMGV